MTKQTAPGKGPHDMGGEQAGPIDTKDHGMKFWQRQANGLRMTIVRSRLLRLDELRRAAEDLGDDYYKLSYFERTTSAIRNILLEKGIVTAEELDAKMAEIRRRFEVPDESLSDIKKNAAS